MDSTAEQLAKLRQAFTTTTTAWQRKRLAVITEMVSSTKPAIEIAEIHDISRRTVMYWHRMFREKGLAPLLERGKSTGRPATLSKRNQREFKSLMQRGALATTADAQRWIYDRTHVWMTPRGVQKARARLGA